MRYAGIGCVFALFLPLAGCGEQRSVTEANDPTPTSTASPSNPETPDPAPTGPVPPGPVPFELVEILNATAAGGETSRGVVVLDSDRAVADFADSFDRGELGVAIRNAAAEAEVPDGSTLVGAVVALGCDVPTRVFVTHTGDELTIRAGKVPSPLPECFAPVTSVALVAVPAAATD